MAAERVLDVALVRLHAVLSCALQVLRDAERSLVDYDERLIRRRARLGALGYPGLRARID